jgi:hypothetical protein
MDKDPHTAAREAGFEFAKKVVSEEEQWEVDLGRLRQAASDAGCKVDPYYASFVIGFSQALT